MLIKTEKVGRMFYRMDYIYTSHRGILRRTNQDNFLCLGQFLPANHNSLEEIITGTAGTEEPILFAVFDGMGGEERGEMASFLAAKTFQATPMAGREQSLVKACMESNREIVRFTEKNGLNTCGTTVAALLFDPMGVVRCDIGDSRIYRLTDQGMEQLSEDDVLQIGRYRKPPLLQFLGIPENEIRIEPHTAVYDAVEGDTYLICSDGLTDMVSEEKIAETIRTFSGEEAGRMLLKAALDAGGRDNITFVLIRLKKQE